MFRGKRLENKVTPLRPINKPHSRGRAAFSSSASPVPAVVDDSLRILTLVREFRSRGHLFAMLDPLKRCAGPYMGEGRNLERSLSGTEASTSSSKARTSHLRVTGPLDLGDMIRRYPWTSDRAARNEFLRRSLGLRSALPSVDLNALSTSSAAKFLDGGRLPRLGGEGEPCDLFEALHAYYCGPLAYEYTHCFTEEERLWWAARAERDFSLTEDESAWLLQRLLRAEILENFLQTSFPSSKRFGLEGCEALIPGVEALVRRSAAHDVSRVEMGMAHRGRINFLANVLNKPFGLLASQMKGEHNQFHVGDVIYHGQYANDKYIFTPFDSEQLSLSAKSKRRAAHEKHVHIGVAPNPSHLEAVNPVVSGMVRALQELSAGTDSGSADAAKATIMSVLFHGDSAFSGQGVVAESLNLSRLDAYDVGGTVHVIINNQIGFTTEPNESRSTPHCTDIARTFGIPTIHVNADDPVSVVRAFRDAADFRAKFKRDVIVDLIGYRRHGHNELDNARATQPLSASLIDAHPRVSSIYSSRLIDQKVITEDQLRSWTEQIRKELETEYQRALAGEYAVKATEHIASSWQTEALLSLAAASHGRVKAQSHNPVQEPTGLPLNTLQWVGQQLTALPEGFRPDPAIEKVIQDRRGMIAGPESRVDWGMAEALALGSLALHKGFVPPSVSPNAEESTPDPSLGLNLGHYRIRLVGQDAERGTFSHRHAVLRDLKTGALYFPLKHLQEGTQEPVEVRNSPLSEEAALGFEYGYSLGVKKQGLVLWEAQFGDFANSAQVMFDQFIASSESKWGQQSGLVVLLPHGYDGQGPDHSSARLERYLQMVNDDPDYLPGQSPQERALIRRTFESLAGSREGIRGLRLEDVVKVLKSASSLAVPGLEDSKTNGNGNGGGKGKELVEVLWAELGLTSDAVIDFKTWRNFMVSYIRRNKERLSNLFVVNATTPAQYFHVLRRQVNLPYSKPLILFTPKKLLHHRPCSSALSDFARHTFFNRVIDDGKESDNTRHLAINPSTGEPYLLPADKIKRVIVCTGQIYYALSAARRTRRIRDIVLIRLEQIAPFPHDRLLNVLNRYPNAEIVWAQEEPKNMGAWNYVRPRLATALQEEFQQQQFSNLSDPSAPPKSPSSASSTGPRTVRYIGRPVSAATATASLAIHTKEMKEIVDFALRSLNFQSSMDF